MDIFKNCFKHWEDIYLNNCLQNNLRSFLRSFNNSHHLTKLKVYCAILSVAYNFNNEYWFSKLHCVRSLNNYSLKLLPIKYYDEFFTLIEYRYPLFIFIINLLQTILESHRFGKNRAGLDVLLDKKCIAVKIHHRFLIHTLIQTLIQTIIHTIITSFLLMLALFDNLIFFILTVSNIYPSIILFLLVHLFWISNEIFSI